jgi:predicted metalloprotease with PDZ domain
VRTPFLPSFILPALLLSWHPLGAQPVHYEVAFPEAGHREARITATWEGLPPSPLELRMSRSSPGRYALHEFAKNVYDLAALDGAGRPLAVTRPNPHQWDVAGHDGTVRVTYTLFADRADGTYAGIDRTQAFLNAPATFLWARSTRDRPVTVTFRPPPGSGWKVATQLEPTDDPFTFRAPHFQYFMDSPVLLADFMLREWEATDGTRSTTIRLALHHGGSEEEADGYADLARRVVDEQVRVWGELPGFDFGTYTFLASYLPWVAGDGMEHRNSTVLTSTAPLATGRMGNLNTLSHEFFHAWNVERFRPRSLEPFDFEEANMADELWLAEGFTSYYDALTIRRAGITGDDSYLPRVAGFLNTVIHGPGRRYHSPIEMSRQAPFVDAAVSIDPHNRANTFISYYTWGSVIALGLDLSIRSRHPGRSLDDLMRALWDGWGREQREDLTPARPYTLADVRATLAEVTDPGFAEEVFTRFIEGREVFDYAALLENAGLLLRPARPGRPTLGPLPIQAQGGRVVVTGSSIVGTPFREAGVNRNDVLLAIGEASVTTTDALQQAVAALSPGQSVTIRFEHRGTPRAATVTVAEDPTLELVPFEQAGRTPTEAQRRFRDNWLGSR